MDSNLLTISCILPQTNPPNPNASKLDLINKNEKFNFEIDNETKNIKAQESVTTDNKTELQPLNDNKQSVGKTDNFQNTKEIQENTKPKSKDLTKSNTDENSSDTEDKSSVESLVKDVAKNVEPKVGHQLAELIAALKENKNLPVTSEINESAEIQELIQKRDNMLQRIKSILSGKSQDLLTQNEDLKNEFVETIKNRIDGKAIDTDKLLLNNKSTIITQEVQKNIKEAKKAIELSNVEDIAKTNKGEDNTGKQKEIIGQKEVLSENIINKRSGENSTDGKVSIFNSNTSNLKADASNFQQKISENYEQKNILNNERLINNKVGEYEGYDKSQVMKKSMLGVYDLNGNSNIQKLNVVSMRNSTDQKGGQNNSTSNINIDSKTKPIYSNNSSQTGTIEQTISSNENVKVSNYVQQNSSSDVPANVGKQIFESIQSSLTNPVGDKQITVRLNPPELGEVFIKFQEQENQITGLLEASKTQTRVEIEQALPQIIRNLSDSGINIKRLEVVLTSSEHQEQETLKDYLLFNGEQHQHNSGNQEMHENEYDMAGIHEWLANNISYDSNSELQDTLTVDSSINILI